MTAGWSHAGCLVIGVQGSKRQLGLQHARAQQGLRPAHWLDWRQWIRPERLVTDCFDDEVLHRALDSLCRQPKSRAKAADPLLLKIEPPGDDVAVHQKLLDLGLAAQGKSPTHTLQYGEFANGQDWFTGLQLALRRLQSLVAAYPQVRCFNPVDDILIMGDKLQCQQYLSQAKLPIAPLLGTVHSFEHWLAMLDAQRLERAFLKARFGSSAAGVLSFRRNRRGAMQATTTARWAKGGKLGSKVLVNSKRLQMYENEDIQPVFDALCAQGAYGEAWVDKPRHAQAHFDLRLLTLGGQPAHCIARLGTRTMTNLHLDSQRVNPSTVLPAEALAQMHAFGIQAAQAFPLSHGIGWDMVVNPRNRQAPVQILEANAFGDLLPGLLWQGLDTYSAAWAAFDHAPVQWQKAG